MYRLSRMAIAFATLVAASVPAIAQKSGSAADYPTRPVRMIVPFAPGGGTDIIGRLVAEQLGQAWGQTVVVDNRGGGGGTIGTHLAAKANPDGYTMVLCSLGISYAPALYSKLPFDPLKDLTPISLVATQPFVYVVIPSLGVNSMKDLIAMAKAKPGQVRYGSGGAGGSSHLGTELLRTMTGIDIVHVPYKGTGPALTAMLTRRAHRGGERRAGLRVRRVVRNAVSRRHAAGDRREDQCGSESCAQVAGARAAVCRRRRGAGGQHTGGIRENAARRNRQMAQGRRPGEHPDRIASIAKGQTTKAA